MIITQNTSIHIEMIVIAIRTIVAIMMIILHMMRHLAIDRTLVVDLMLQPHHLFLQVIQTVVLFLVLMGHYVFADQAFYLQFVTHFQVIYFYLFTFFYSFIAVIALHLLYVLFTVILNMFSQLFVFYLLITFRKRAFK